MNQAIEAVLRAALKRAVAAGDLPAVAIDFFRVEPPAAPVFGDLASNLALLVAQRTDRLPRVVADCLRGHICDPHGWFASVKTAGPGFLNFRLTDAYWLMAFHAALAPATLRRAHPAATDADGVLLVCDGEDSGLPPLDALRAAVVWDALARLLDAAGYIVEPAGDRGSWSAVWAELGITPDPTRTIQTDDATAACARVCAALPGAALYSNGAGLWLRNAADGDRRDRLVRDSDGRVTLLGDEMTRVHSALHGGHAYYVRVGALATPRSAIRLRPLALAMGLSARRARAVPVAGVEVTRSGVAVGGAASNDPVAFLVAALGGDAARFFLLWSRPDRPAVIELRDPRTPSPDDPFVAVQYAHTRLSQLRRQAAAAGVVEGLPPDLSALGEPEMALIREVARWPDVVVSAARALQPHQLVFYAVALAGAFHRYYNRGRIVTDDVTVYRARLSVLSGVQHLLRTALQLVGVTVPERM